MIYLVARWTGTGVSTRVNGRDLASGPTEGGLGMDETEQPSFGWLVFLKVISRDVLGRADLLASIVGAFAAFVVPRIMPPDAAQNAMTDLAWRVPVYASTAVVLYRVLWAPSRVYADLRTERDGIAGQLTAARAILERKPVLTLDVTTSPQHDQWLAVQEPNAQGEMRHTHDRYYKFLTVLTTRRAPGCVMKVNDLRNADGTRTTGFSPTPLRWHGTEAAEKDLIGSDRILFLSRRPTQRTTWDLESPDRLKVIGQAFQFPAGDYEIELIATSADTLEETRVVAALHVGAVDLDDVRIQAAEPHPNPQIL